MTREGAGSAASPLDNAVRDGHQDTPKFTHDLVTPAAASLVDYACRAGLVDTPADLDLVERLAVQTVERREAYLDGLLERKAASVAISCAADWPRVATELDDARRARAYRTRMLAPREDDYAGRRGA
jgi:hypothetical protein